MRMLIRMFEQDIFALLKKYVQKFLHMSGIEFKDNLEFQGIF